MTPSLKGNNIAWKRKEGTYAAYVKTNVQNASYLATSWWLQQLLLPEHEKPKYLMDQPNNHTQQIYLGT